MKSPKIKLENVPILSPSVKKLESPKLSQKIEMKSTDENDKIDKIKATPGLKTRKKLSRKT